MVNHEYLKNISQLKNLYIVEAGKKNMSGEKLNKIIEKCCNKAAEMEKIIVQSIYFITFTKVLKCLGSWDVYNLCDEYDILRRIKKANQTMGVLNLFWIADSIDLHDKFLIFVVVPLNLLFWLCESWDITKKLQKKIEMFQTKCLRRILRIRWEEVNKKK